MLQRGLLQQVDHPSTGSRRQQGLPLHIEGIDLTITAPAPRFGEHTETVLRDVLGLEPERLNELRAADVIATEPRSARRPALPINRAQSRLEVTHVTANGARLRLIEAGPVHAPAILLVNDGSDRAVSWDRQFSSPLTDEFRVISVDIGEDGRLGLAAVIDQRGLDGIVIVGWSRSIRAIIEYLRVDGQDAVAGLGFVDWGQEFVDATGVLSALLVPVLLSNRSQDQTLPTTTRDRILAACLTARESVYDGQRPPFVEDPVRFNLELADFVARANRDRPARAPAAPIVAVSAT